MHLTERLLREMTKLASLTDPEKIKNRYLAFLNKQWKSVRFDLAETRSKQGRNIAMQTDDRQDSYLRVFGAWQRLSRKSRQAVRQSATLLALILENKASRPKKTADHPESEASLRSIFRAAPLGIGTVSNRIFLNVNRRLCEMVGYSQKELIGKNARILYPSQKEYEFVGQVKYDQIRTHGTGSVETRFRRKDGEIIDIFLSSTPLDPQHPTEKVTFTALDITERKQTERALLAAKHSLERERNLLQEVMNGAKNVHLVYLDRDFNFVRVNAAYAKTCGYEPQEMIGKNHFELYPHPENEVIFKQVRDTGQAYEVKDKPFTFPDQPDRGVTYWDWSLYPVKGEQGRVTGLVFSLVETTARKQAEEALKYSEKQFRKYFELGLVGMAIETAEGDWVEVNDKLCDMFGYSRAELFTKHWADLTHPDDIEKDLQEFRQLVNGELDQYALEKRFIGKSGQVMTWIISVSCTRAANGTADRVYAIAIDISEQKKVQAALQKSEEKFRVIAESISDDIWQLDRQGKVTYVSPAVETIFGYTPQEALEKNYRDFFIESELPRAREAFAKALKGKKQQLREFSGRHKNGHIIPIEVSVSPIEKEGRIIGVQGVARDISERKQIEQSLESERIFLAAAFDNIEECIIICNQEGDLVRFNKAARELHGLSAEPIPPEQWAEYCDLYQLDGTTPLKKEAVPLFRALHGERVRNAEIVVAPKNSRPYYMVCNGQPLVDKKGQKYGAIVTMHDITARVLSEKALKESEDKFRTLVNQAPQALFLHDLEGRIVDVNQAALDHYGYTRQELLKMTAKDIDPDYEVREDGGAFWKALRKEGAIQFEARHRRKDGTLFPVEIKLTALELRDNQYIFALADNITDRKQAEQILQKERDKAQTYLDVAGTIFVTLNRQGEVTLVNQKGSQILGYPQTDIMGRNWFDHFIPEEDRSQVKTIFRQLMDGKLKTAEYVENYVLNSQGEKRLIAWHNTLLKDQQGQITGSLSSGIDITKKKQIINSLQESEHKFRTLVENIVDWVWQVDTKGVYTYVSPQAEKIMGYPREEILGKTPFDFMAPAEAERVGKIFKQIAAKKEKIIGLEDTLITKDGQALIFETNATPMFDQENRFIGYMGTCRDITARKKTDEELRHSEQQKNIILDSTNEMVAYYDLDLKIVWANRAAAESVNKSPAELVGQQCYEIWMGKTQPCPGCPVLKARESKAPQQTEQQTPDGRYWSLRGYPVLDDSHKVVGLVEFGQDITESRMAAEKVKESERKYRHLVETIPYGIEEVDLEGHMVFVNQMFADMLGYEPEELLEKYIWDHDPKPDKVKQLKDYFAYIKDKQPEPEPYESQNRCKDGKIIDVLVDWNYKRDKHGKLIGFISVVTDITAQKQAERDKDQYINELQLINDTVIASSRLKEVDQVCDLIATKIEAAIPQIMVIVSLFDTEQQAIRIRAVRGLGDMTERVLGIIGADPREMYFKPEEMGREAQLYTSGKLELIEGGIHTLVMGKIPAPVCRSIAKILRIKKTYSVGFAHNQNPYGGIIILSRTEEPPKYQFAIETIAGHLSLIIHNKQVHQMLQQSENRFRMLFDKAPVSFWVEDYSRLKQALDDLIKKNKISDIRQYLQTRPERVKELVQKVNILDVNQKTISLYKAQNKTELLDKLTQIFVPESYEGFIEQIAAVAEGKTELQLETINKKLNGDIIQIQLNWSVPEIYQQDYARVFVGINDITERKWLQDSLAKANQEKSLVLDSTAEMIAYYDRKLRIVWCNRAMAVNFESTPDQLAGKSCYELWHNRTEHCVNCPVMVKVLETGQAQEAVRTTPKDQILSVRAYPILDDQARVTHVGAFIQDITDQKKTENRINEYYHELEENQKAAMNLMEDLTGEVEDRRRVQKQLQASLKEKEALLSEIHHRVKNNMQIVQSFINLQSQHIKDQPALDAFQDLNDRIRTMALVHEKLYRSDDLSQIDFADYIKSLVTRLFAAYKAERLQGALQLKCEHVLLDIETAIPCGLLINELVTNIIKYAFPDGLQRKPEIYIAFRTLQKQKCELIIADNGIGLPVELDIRKTESFGLEMVYLLAERQLDGKISLDRKQGTRYTIRFECHV